MVHPSCGIFLNCKEEPTITHVAAGLTLTGIIVNEESQIQGPTYGMTSFIVHPATFQTVEIASRSVVIRSELGREFDSVRHREFRG